MGRTRIYLDHAAGSPLLPEVSEAMADVAGLPGNPSSLHASGRRARSLLEDARESIAAALGAHPQEVVFTSGGTEANNLAVLGGWRGRRAQEPDRARIVISAVEHPSVAGVLRLAPDSVSVAPATPAGRVDVADLADRLDESVALVSVMWVNNETGTVQPVAEVARQAARVGAWAHTDAVQALGHLPIDFAASGLDLLTVSAHKIGGPVGIGALVVRRGVAVEPLGFGGGQDRRLRSGTLPAALAVGFAAAVRLAEGRRAQENTRLAALRGALVASALERVPRVLVNGGGEASPAILNLGFEGCRADDLLLLLDEHGIDCSTGSACTAGVHQPSEVLLAMGRTPDQAGASLRFSFGPSTTPDDLATLADVLPEVVAAARRAYTAG